MVCKALCLQCDHQTARQGPEGGVRTELGEGREKGGPCPHSSIQQGPEGQLASSAPSGPAQGRGGSLCLALHDHYLSNLTVPVQPPRVGTMTAFSGRETEAWGAKARQLDIRSLVSGFNQCPQDPAGFHALLFCLQELI
jgi:hypothetical protein